RPRRRPSHPRRLRAPAAPLPTADTLLFRWPRLPRPRLVGGVLDSIPYRAARRTKDEVRPQPFSRPERSELRDWLARPSHPANARTDGAREAAHQPRLLGAIPLPIARLVFFLRIHAPVRWLGGPYLW